MIQYQQCSGADSDENKVNNSDIIVARNPKQFDARSVVLQGSVKNNLDVFDVTLLPIYNLF